MDVSIWLNGHFTPEATYLTRWAIERAKENVFHMIQLATDKKRPKAKRFYKKMGFVASHEGMKLKLKS